MRFFLNYQKKWLEDELLEPKEVLRTQEVLIDGNKILQVLIKWKGKIMDEATWMNFYDFCNQFPTSSLLDKAGHREGIDSRSPKGGDTGREANSFKSTIKRGSRRIFH